MQKRQSFVFKFCQVETINIVDKNKISSFACFLFCVQVLMNARRIPLFVTLASASTISAVTVVPVQLVLTALTVKRVSTLSRDDNERHGV